LANGKIRKLSVAKKRTGRHLCFDLFMNQLIQNKITKFIGVRKNAFSMKRGFSKTTLKNTLQGAGIEYEHIPKLGIESDKRQKLGHNWFIMLLNNKYVGRNA